MNRNSGQQDIMDTATSSNGEVLAERLLIAVQLLNDSIEIDPDVISGVPVVRGTRISVARVLAEIADNASLSEIADNLEIDFQSLKNIIEGLSIRLDRPLTE
ncbi:MAG TPA: DUF433 domain-containing protein [Pirellulales bacterium]|nr:DUF433 domain-containing protein [Pirellulales bacterium]